MISTSSLFGCSIFWRIIQTLDRTQMISRFQRSKWFPLWKTVLMMRPFPMLGDRAHVTAISRYIEFFADCIITKENVSLVHYLIQKLKMVRDATSSGHSQNLYVLSELAQHVVRARAELNGWTLTSHPTTLKMPTDIFKPLPSREVALEVCPAS